ncbi:MAG TPA: hypothetical protein VGB42_09345 [Candidatus Thermoplasmatota archaeon]
MSSRSSTLAEGTPLAAVTLTPHPEKEHLVVCRIRAPEGCVGRGAKLVLERVVRVKDSRPVHERIKLWETELRIESTDQELAVPRPALGRGYDYDGHEIDIRVESRLTIDDGIFFDTELEGVHRLDVLDRPSVDGCAKELSEPEDAFDFFSNLAAIPARNRLVTIALAAVGGVLIAVNALVGLHDQLAPEAQTWLYSHVDSDGDSQSPLVGALMGCGALGAAVWFAMRRQLRKYMTFALARDLRVPGRDTVVPAGRLVSGKARVPIDRATFRVVAYNRELGQYRRGSGTDERTVSFQTPVRAVKLFEQVLQDVPAGAPIERYLEGDVPFLPMFAALYPPLRVSASHGIDVKWEVQLLHPLFVDQEIVSDGDPFPYEAFLDG